MMRAHQLDADGVIVNTIVVHSLDVFPNLVDAANGGKIGDRIVDGVVVPKPGPSISSLRAASWADIKAIRDTKIQTGGYQAQGKWFHSDTFSRTQQLALVMMGGSVPPVPWKTMDGTFVTMTQALAAAIFQAGAANDTAMFGHAESLRAQVEAASDPAAIDINAGWPATFA